MKRLVTDVLAMVPVGAVCDFLCGLIVILESLIIAVSRREENMNGGWLNFISVCAYLALVYGSTMGFILTPLAYLLTFTNVSGRNLVKATLIIGVVTIFCGLLGGLANIVIAFITTLVGFVSGCLVAFLFIKYRSPNRSLP